MNSHKQRCRYTQTMTCAICVNDIQGPCVNDIQGPCVLDCGHAFCDSCMHHWCMTKPKITCPTCRNETQVMYVGSFEVRYETRRNGYRVRTSQIAIKTT